MELKGRMSRTILNASFLALDLSLFLYIGFPFTPTKQGNLSFRQPVLADTPQVISVGNTGVLSAVIIEASRAFPIVQQPGGKPNYVSKNPGELTQFASASQYGNIGLLAHNYLSGQSFFRLAVGQEIRLEYEDGSSELFVVSEILQYQALEPKSPFSSFRNLNDRNEVLSASQMFERAYGGDRRVTFQTCIARYGNASWGRLFVVAIPKPASS